MILTEIITFHIYINNTKYFRIICNEVNVWKWVEVQCAVNNPYIFQLSIPVHNIDNNKYKYPNITVFLLNVLSYVIFQR